MEDNLQTAPADNEGGLKQYRGFFTCELAVALLLMVLAAAGYFLFGLLRFVFLLIIGALLGAQAINYRRKGYGKKLSNRVAGDILVLLIVAALLLWFGPMSLHSRSLFKYPLQRAYLENGNYTGDIDFIPKDISREVKGDYSLDYMASVMQGTGHFSVRYTADGSTVAAYESKFSKQAAYTITLSEMEWGMYRVDNPENEYLNTVSVYYDEDFWTGFEDSATVYVLYTNLDFNHPHSSAVIVDAANGRIQFTRLG